MSHLEQFENLVNYDGYKAIKRLKPETTVFENLVNYDGYKALSVTMSGAKKFENLVNYDGYKARSSISLKPFLFENLVNYDGYKAPTIVMVMLRSFENLVNYDGYKASNGRGFCLEGAIIFIKVGRFSARRPDIPSSMYIHYSDMNDIVILGIIKQQTLLRVRRIL